VLLTSHELLWPVNYLALVAATHAYLAEKRPTFCATVGTK